MLARAVLVLSFLIALAMCGRVGYEPAQGRDGGGQVVGDGGGPDDGRAVVDAGNGVDAALPPIGACADWSNWICQEGGGQCYATCGGYTADCYPDGCVCETSLGIIECETPPGDCGSCEMVMLEGCCGPLP